MRIPLISTFVLVLLPLLGCKPLVKPSASRAEETGFRGELSMERLLGSPSLSGPSVRGVKMSPDGSRVTFLRGKEAKKDQLDLWEFNISDGEIHLLVDSNDLLKGEVEVLSEEEKARRERQRIRGSGIIGYSWNEAGTALLFPLGGDAYIKPLDGAVKRLTYTEAFETDFRFSPKGSYVSFIRDRDLYAVEVATGREIQLTSGANDVIAHGVAEFAAQEEMDRNTGYWWAPDESRIAFTRIDESSVELLNRYGMTGDGNVTTRAQRYPVAGSPNALVELGVVTVESGEIAWIDLGENEDIYLARVDWLPDSSEVLFQRMPRDQESLDLVAADASRGKGRLLLRETSDTWINLHDDLRFLEKIERFIWSSERRGYRHLYLYDNDGTEIGALTEGDWVVSQLVRVDEAAGKVYFMGFKDGTVERHLYVVSLQPDSSSIERVTSRPGWHSVEMGNDAMTFLDSYSDSVTPPQIALRSVDGDVQITYINENSLDETHPYFPYWDGHAKSEYGQILAADGITQLDYRLILPPTLKKGQKYPAVLAPYGGPFGHRVKNSFELGQNQMFAREGFVVLVVDGRGSYDRGVAFESGIKNAMGTVEVEDQIAAARFLQSLDYVDENRIGIHGWSYGGYMTLMMLAKAPELIKVGVSGAPVTDFRLYDTAYTERYLGHPAAPGDVYDNSSVFKYVDSMTGKLLLIHGMADDNVFFDNSVKLIAALQGKGVQFDLMVYPGQKHSFQGDAIKMHVANLRLNYFKEHL